MEDVKRLFCAVKVPLTEGIAEAFEVYRRELAGEAIKWVEPHNLHLTLRFFGDTPADRLDEIVAALQSAARRFPSQATPKDMADGASPDRRKGMDSSSKDSKTGKHPMLNYEVRGCGHFASRGQPRVIWMGIEQAAGLKRLYRLIKEELLPMGYEPERQAFSPHLTLGRIKSLKHIELLRDLEKEFADTLFASVSTTNFLLMESILKPKGPVYHEAVRFPFQ
jgi:RNA 2',3'-cyclic 3'-phosphodiesterase